MYKQRTRNILDITSLIYLKTVSFYLSGKLTYSFSSYQAIVAFENAATKYEKRYNNMRDTLPDFLDLLKRLDSESGITDDISNQYKTKINHKNYFCEIQ